MNQVDLNLIKATVTFFSEVAGRAQGRVLTGFRECLLPGVQTDHSHRRGVGLNRFGFAEHLLEVFIKIQRSSIFPECVGSAVEKSLDTDF